MNSLDFVGNLAIGVNLFDIMDCCGEITVIDDKGFWLGVYSNTDFVRGRLREKGFAVGGSCASKQYK